MASALGRLRQEDPEFKVSLDYIVGLSYIESIERRGREREGGGEEEGRGGKGEEGEAGEGEGERTKGKCQRTFKCVPGTALLWRSLHFLGK